MLNGSCPGVITAAVIVMIRIAIFRLARKSLTVKTPIRSRNNITSGVWNEIPKIEREDRGKTHPVAEPKRRRNAQPDVELQQEIQGDGQDEEEAQEYAGKKQAE